MKPFLEENAIEKESNLGIVCLKIAQEQTKKFIYIYISTPDKFLNILSSRNVTLTKCKLKL